VEKLATKIIEIGHGEAVVYPGTYTEFLWSKKAREAQAAAPAKPVERKSDGKSTPAAAPPKTQGSGLRADQKAQGSGLRAQGNPPQPNAQQDREERKRVEAERKKKQRELDSLRKRISDLESRISTSEAEVKQLEAAMSESGFYEDVARSKPVIDRHQALMWEVGDLMAQWEALQNHAAEHTTE
jgi:ATP-binding cassette subfamily F protein 3